MPSVHERRPGVWTIRVPNGTDKLTGKRLTITETFLGSEKGATQRAEDLAVDTRRHPKATHAKTLRQAITEWRDEADHASGTARNYDLAVATLPGHLLKTAVAKIDTATIRELYRRVAKDHGPHRAVLVHALISGALTHAWREGWIPDNPARRVKAPKVGDRKSTTPSALEVRKLLAIVSDDPELHAWLLLSTTLGARRSEILALRWSDIDLTAGQVAITKALDPVGGGVKAVKANGDRTIAIGPATMEALEVWYQAFHARARELGAGPTRDPHVFAGNWEGTRPWRPDVATKRFRRLADRAGVVARLHDCRHAVATELLMAGIPLKVVGDRLGHTRLSTTSDLYGDTIPASDQAAALAMEAAIT